MTSGNVTRLIAFSLAASATAGAHAAVRFSDCLKQPAGWYATDEARYLAENVIRYQAPEGGWPKNRDMTLPPEAHHDSKETPLPTIDNDATTTQLELLTRVIYAGRGEPVFKEAFLRGFDYLLAAQYENGGWPQFFPLRKGYYAHVTFNDDAMVNVLALLRDCAKGMPPFAGVGIDAERCERAARAFEKGVECILRCQVTLDGVKTAWCAQHDVHSLEPAWARNYEPPSLSGMESVGIVRFLMQIESPDPSVVAAIESAVEWFGTAAIEGLRVERFVGADGKRDVRTFPDQDAPRVWARFYDLETGAPVFTGRDRVPRARLDDIEYERRNGYGYLGDWPAKLLEREYPKWRKNHGLP